MYIENKNDNQYEIIICYLKIIILYSMKLTVPTSFTPKNIRWAQIGAIYEIINISWMN